MHVAADAVQIAKRDRFSWTRVLTSRCDFVVANFAEFSLGLNLGVLNALDAVSTFLHHTAAANGDFRVHHQVLQIAVTRRQLVCARVLEECFGVGVVEEVKATYFVRTVVAAITRTDTAVVNHVVKAFATVNGRRDRTNRLARSVLTVVTGHRLVNDHLVIVLGRVIVV